MKITSEGAAWCLCRMATWLFVFAVVQTQASSQQTGSPRLPSPATRTLVEAVKKGDVAGARGLLDRGADPNGREVLFTKTSLAAHAEGGKPYLGDTALNIAAYKGDLSMTRLLLQRGANPNGTAQAGWTPLIEATTGNHPEVVKLLLSHGAKVNQRNEFGDPALGFADDDGHLAIAKILLRHGADINGGIGWTPLARAAYNGQKEAVRFFLREGANPNFHRKGYMTALEAALAQGLYDLAETIRKAGGRGRSKEALSADRDRRVALMRKKEKDTRHARASRSPGDRIVTDDDRRVIETVLLHVLEDRAEDRFFAIGRSPKIALVSRTFEGPSFYTASEIDNDLDTSMNGELNAEQANEISLDMREQLQRRNWEPVSLTGFEPSDKRIILVNQNEKTGGDFDQPFTKATAWVQVYLPGYSPKHDRAVLRFWIGPSPHGAMGTYFLTQQDGMWHVKWRRFTHFL